MEKQAILVLADGSVFQGVSIGVDGWTVGEVVFNTAMTGYQEILTDPSYAEQLVTLTYPHIGNVGTNDADYESDAVHAKGLIIRDLAIQPSNWRQQQSLPEFLQQHNVVAIADIDTRRLTRILRDKGAQNGCLIAGEALNADSKTTALENARQYPGLHGVDLAKTVTCADPYEWLEGSWSLESGYVKHKSTELPHHVVAYDFGVKRNILRLLVDRGCRVTVVPAQTPAQAVLALNPDGVFLSNGPGDPAACDYAIEAIHELLDHDVPLFGICLGHQLLALASGARTEKMKFGHQGANHPVIDVDSRRVFITSQNHGFAVAADSLPPAVKATHFSLFDGTLQGIECLEKPAYGFQGHPEASPGPHDIIPVFDRFIQSMNSRKQQGL